MKKYLLGILAIVIAVGFSAFDTKQIPVKKDNASTTLYYFQISGDHLPETEVPVEDAIFLGTNPPETPNCAGSGNQCISVFDDTQVDEVNEILDGPQTPISTYTQKS